MNWDFLDWTIIGPALLAGMLVLSTHVPLGQVVLKRGIIFIDLAIAQIAALGVIAAGAFGLEENVYAVQLAAVSAALLAAACSSGTDDSQLEASDGTSDLADNLPASPVGSEGLPPELADDLESTPIPGTDMELPANIPDTAAGAMGYTHYVFSNIDGEIIPIMVEGQRGGQVRCDQVALPCSASELAALYESGDEIPEELGMDRETLGQLVPEDALDGGHILVGHDLRKQLHAAIQVAALGGLGWLGVVVALHHLKMSPGGVLALEPEVGTAEVEDVPRVDDLHLAVGVDRAHLGVGLGDAIEQVHIDLRFQVVVPRRPIGEVQVTDDD